MMSKDRRRKCEEAALRGPAVAEGGAREGENGKTVGGGGGRSGLGLNLGVAAAAAGEGTAIEENDDDDFDDYDGAYGDDDDDNDDDDDDNGGNGGGGGVDYDLFVDEFGNAFEGQMFIDKFGSAFDSKMFSDEFRDAFDGVYKDVLFDDDMGAGDDATGHHDSACFYPGDHETNDGLSPAEAILRARRNARMFAEFGCRGQVYGEGDDDWPEPWASVDYAATVEEQVVLLESLGAFVTPPGWSGRLGTGRLAKLADASEVRRR